MVKTTMSKKLRAKAKGNQPRRKRPNTPTAAGMVQAPARQAPDALQKWYALLRDPCNATLTAPPYGGSGSGLYIRQVQNITFNNYATATDMVLEFSPSGQDALGTFSPTSVLRYAYTAGPTGSSLGTAAGIALNGLVGNQAVCVQKRCLAACLRFQYTGTELERKGLIGAVLSPNACLGVGETVDGSAADHMTVMPNVGRVGEVHEYKWCPSEEDQWFVASSGSTEPGQSVNRVSGNTLRVGVRNIQPGTLTIQLVACWEWVPVTESASGTPWASDQVRGPAISIPFQTALAGVGDLGKFVASKAADFSPMLKTAATAGLRIAALAGL